MRLAGGSTGRVHRLVADHLSEPQHRNAYYLMGNTLVGAAAGVLFWFLFTRVAALPVAAIGIGYAVVALGTIVGVVAKGGLDTAIVRWAPRASRAEGARLLRFAALWGAGLAAVVALGLGWFAGRSALLPGIDTAGWWLVGAIGVLLVVTWLQDAHFLAQGDARWSFHRNLVLSAARILLPLPVLLVAASLAVPLTWALALALSGVAAMLFARRLPQRQGGRVPRGAFLATAGRNVSGSAAEFLPGLLLAPLVLALSGAEAAGHFGIAWTAASLLFLGSAAVSRSTLARMAHDGPRGRAAAIRRGAVQHLWTVVPAAAAAVVLAPLVLAVFGPEYAREGAPVFAVLAVSALVVAPVYLYLALLRAEERVAPLVTFPLLLVAALAVLAPLLGARYGPQGVAVAWALANLPFAAWAAWKLRLAAKGVTTTGPAPALGGPADAG